MPDYRHHALIVLAGVSCVFAPLAADWLANWSKAKQVERQAQRLAGQQRRRQAATDAFLKHKYRLEKDMAQLFNEMQEEGATLDEITKRTKQLKQANNKSLTAELKLLADEEARSQSP
ncbi:MAG TPA: hypothetical protein VNH11_26050 [Pirellulales bacterium]|nr:hypothetical protein [Pirellulales bacterium]